MRNNQKILYDEVKRTKNKFNYLKRNNNKFNKINYKFGPSHVNKI